MNQGGIGILASVALRPSNEHRASDASSRQSRRNWRAWQLARNQLTFYVLFKPRRGARGCGGAAAVGARLAPGTWNLPCICFCLNINAPFGFTPSTPEALLQLSALWSCPCPQSFFWARRSALQTMVGRPQTFPDSGKCLKKYLMQILALFSIKHCWIPRFFADTGKKSLGSRVKLLKVWQ